MATINQTLTSCPADCADTALLLAIPTNQDCASYPLNRSQIARLYIIPSGAPDIFANWSTTPTAVSGAVDNTVTNNTKSKYLAGIGGVAVAEKTVTDYPFRKKRTTDRTYPLTFRMLNLSDDQYAFLRQIQCGTLGFTFYYGDLSDYVYGIAGGLVPDFIDVKFPKGEGNTDKNVAIISLSWKANADPQRKVNPLA